MEANEITETAITSHQLIQLVLCEGLIILPPIRMVLFFVVNTTVGSSKIRIPEPFTMPVWLGKITSHHKTLLAENIKHMKRHILTRVIFERTISYRKISVFRIESAKTIVMLSCENHVFNM